jgi:D-xylulose kinase
MDLFRRWEMAYLLGLDAGTTSFKAALFDDEGREVASASSEYSLLTPEANIVEIEAETYWKVCKLVLSEVCQKADVGDIKALAISSQGETLISLDKDGRPLRRAIVWLDNRSEAEAEILKSELGKRSAFEITGQPDIVPTWPATKILWMKRNEPNIFNRVHKYLLLEDYLIYKLTGKFAAEGSLLSSSLLFDIRRKVWWKEMMEFLGISEESLPEIYESGEAVGEVRDEVSKEIRLPKGTLVVTGAFDQAASTIGAGNIKPGVITECTGAALAICATIDEPLLDPEDRIPCHYHAIRNKYYLLPWCQTAGMALKWFRDEFYQYEKEKGLAYKLMDDAAASVSPGSDGLLMLPHLMGAVCPEFNPNARGCYFGFSLSTTRAHFIRALLEAVAFMLRKNLEILEELGVEIREIRAIGGGARSELWNRIKADATGKSLSTVRTSETACLGAAILAGMGVSTFPSFDVACERMVQIKDRIFPNEKNLALYRAAYEKYIKLYEALEPLF